MVQIISFLAASLVFGAASSLPLASRAVDAATALQNGQQAQSQNAQFASLSASSTCTGTQEACVNGGFAQCVGGQFQTTQCGAGTQCFALPLVNSAGTSITCSTAADAASRIAATGAQGGVTGSGSTAGNTSAASNTTGNATAAPSSAVAAAPSAAAPSSAAAAPAAASSAASSSGFQLQNGQQAQSQNAQFASLTANSACTAGQQACVSGSFAQCVGGKFQTTACGAGTQCFALPLVNKPGTSVTCSTSADAASRIAATGAQGGVTGS